jgi:hypothetical protein
MNSILQFRRCICLIAIAASASILIQIHAQTASTNFWKSISPGPHLFGYFEGRSPCQEIIHILNAPDKAECIKIKWQLVLYQDPVTRTPTTYALGGFAWRNPPKTGKWRILKGCQEDPDAVVYQLYDDNSGSFLSFMRGDDNVIFFLDRDGKLLVGNEKFSYTLNRAEMP